MTTVGPRDLVRITEAARMLAEAKTLPQIRQVHNVAQRARDYAKAARLGLDAQNSAAAIAIEAERRAGELLVRMKLTGERAVGGESLRPVPDSQPATLDELGITKDESSRWQKVASVPGHTITRYVASATEDEQEVTRAGLLRFAQGALVSHNSGDVEWYTPPGIIAAARAAMGAIDLDPASTEEANAVVGATRFFTAEQDGLAQPWHGCVWLNPPYAQPAVRLFCEKLTASVVAGIVEQACVLVNNGTETQWFQGMAEVATAICFPRGRLRYWHAERDSSSPLQGQAVVYFGPRLSAFRAAFGGFGFVVTL